MKSLEVAFGIISKAGGAKSNYLESISYSRVGDYDKAISLIEEADNLRIQAHEEHFELVQLEAQGSVVELSLILVHAEDQLAGAEMLKILSMEFLENYKLIHSFK